jgi:hypothetical protein
MTYEREANTLQRLFREVFDLVDETVAGITDDEVKHEMRRVSEAAGFGYSDDQVELREPLMELLAVSSSSHQSRPISDRLTGDKLAASGEDKILSRPSFPNVSPRKELQVLADRIERGWPSLPHPLVLAWSDSPIAAMDRIGAPWIFGPVEQLYGSSGRTVVPRNQLARLKRVAKLGVPFQRLAIAHELDPEGVRELLPGLQQTEPRSCSTEDARKLLLLGGVRFPEPLIFGIIAPTHPRDGQLCLWYPLVDWRW